VLWTEEQAALLRNAKDSNRPLDWRNLAEEIESLGKSDAWHITRILRHLLKLAVSPATAPRAGGQESIADARDEIEGLLVDSPSLRREVDDLTHRQILVAAGRAAGDLARQSQPTEKVWARVESGGFTAEEVLGDWFPEPPG
jgi:hypothetical protein